MVSLRCALNNFRKWTGNPKIWVVGAFLVLYLSYLLSGVNDFCRDAGHPIGPWLFPFLFSNSIVHLLLTLALILLLCDAPFLDRQQVFLLLRVGRYRWAVGQMLYVALSTLVYLLAVFILTLVLTLPHLQWMEGWGKVIGTLTQTNVGERYGIMTMPFRIMDLYEPLEALVLSFVLQWGVGIFLGLLLFFLSLWCSKALSVGGTTALALLPSLLGFEMFNRYSYLSPVSWSNLHLISGQLPHLSLSYVRTALPLCIIGLAALILLTIHKNTLTVQEDAL